MIKYWYFNDFQFNHFDISNKNVMISYESNILLKTKESPLGCK